MTDIGAFTKATIVSRTKQISDAVIDRAPLLSKLKAAGRIVYGKGGDGFNAPVRARESTIGGSVSDWDTGGAQTTQPFEEVSFKYRQYLWRLMINNFQEDRNSYADATAKIFDMVAQQTAEVRQAASKRLEVHMMSDGSTLSTGDAAGSTPMEGLESIIGTTNTHGGINRTTSTNAWWRAQRLSVANFTLDSDGDGNTNGIEAMDQLLLDCEGGEQKGEGVPDDVAGDMEKPDEIITTKTGFRYYRRSLNPQNQYVGNKQDPNKALYFDDIALSWAPNCTAGVFYFLNTKFLRLWIVGKQLLRVMKKIEKDSPLVTVYVLGTQGQFWCPQPRYQGRLAFT